MLINNEARAAVLISSKPGCFIAGADISWLDSAETKEEVGYCTYVFCYLATMILTPIIKGGGVIMGGTVNQKNYRKI